MQEKRRGGVPQGKKQGWVTVLRGEKEQVPKAPLRGAQVSLTTQGNAGVQEHLFLHLTQEHGDGSSFFPNEHNFLFSLMLSYSLGSIKMPLSDRALDTLKSLGQVKADKNSSLCCSFLPVRPTSNARPTWTLSGWEQKHSRLRVPFHRMCFSSLPALGSYQQPLLC